MSKVEVKAKNLNKKQGKKQKLAAALKENLRRRKALVKPLKGSEN